MKAIKSGGASVTRKVLGGVGAAMVVLASSAANAGNVNAGDVIRLVDSYGSTGGGEFKVAEYPGFQKSFVTFCLEINQSFVSPEPELVKSITKVVDSGGAGGPKPDPISNETAYLYTKFFESTLSGYHFNDTGAQRVADANSLQLAFWYLEQEIPTLTDAKALAWVDEAKAAGWQNTGNVQVLNLYRKDAQGNFTVQAQDVLYLPVPEPESYAMLLAGLGLMGFVARRRRG